MRKENGRHQCCCSIDPPKRNKFQLNVLIFSFGLLSFFFIAIVGSLTRKEIGLLAFTYFFNYFLAVLIAWFLISGYI